MNEMEQGWKNWGVSQNYYIEKRKLREDAQADISHGDFASKQEGNKKSEYKFKRSISIWEVWIGSQEFVGSRYSLLVSCDDKIELCNPGNVFKTAC